MMSSKIKYAHIYIYIYVLSEHSRTQINSRGRHYAAAFRSWGSCNCSKKNWGGGVEWVFVRFQDVKPAAVWQNRHYRVEGLQIIAVLHGQTCFMHKFLYGRKSSGAMARMDWDGREARALFDSWLRLHLLDKDTVLDNKTIWLIRNLGDRDIITLCVMLCVSVSIFGRLHVVAEKKLKFEFFSPTFWSFVSMMR